MLSAGRIFGRFRFFLVFFTAALPHSVMAQQPPVLELLKRVNAQVPPPSDSEIAVAMTALWARLKAADPAVCTPTDASHTPPQPATADRMIFNAVLQNQAKNGWTILSSSKICGVVSQRFVIARMADDSLLAIPANYGESFVTSSQFRDTAMQAVMAATANTPALRDEKCRTSRPEGIETRVIAKGSDLGPDVFGGRYAGNWQEEWVVRQCGMRVAVPISFTADGDGGVYTRIQSAKIRPLTP